MTIGRHFVTTRVVHLPKRAETSLITESDQSRANHHLLQPCTVRTAWSDSDQAVQAVHSCKSWLWLYYSGLDETLLLLGTPPKKRRQSMNVSQLRHTPVTSKQTPTGDTQKRKELNMAQGAVDLIMALSPEDLNTVSVSFILRSAIKMEDLK